MRIGLLAYSTQTGLGYQTRDFYKHIDPEHVLIADISEHNHMPVDHSWCTNPHVISQGIPSHQDCEWLVDNSDVIFVCETPLNYHLFQYARQKRVPTVLQYNYEFLDYFRIPHAPMPEVMAAPTTWGIDEVRKIHPNVINWGVPIDTDKFYRHSYLQLNTFVHITGRPAAHDRNGTIPFLKAAMLIGKKFRYKVYLQTPKESMTAQYFEPIGRALNEAQLKLGDHLEIILDCEDNYEMYQTGQVLVLPRRYGGLCIPMWEALASGMPVIMTDVEPNNTILPKSWLIESFEDGMLKKYPSIKLYSVREVELANRMLSIADEIIEQSVLAHEIAEKNSWKAKRHEVIRHLETA